MPGYSFIQNPAAILLVLLLVGSCSRAQEQASKPEPAETIISDYPIEPVNIREVKLTDDFWLPVIKRVQEKICICHMNEGHSAFSGLERIRIFSRQFQKSFAEAFEIVKASSVFTTHTPVKAGIDLFAPDLIRKYFSDYCKEVGITINELLALGRVDAQDVDGLGRAQRSI